MANEKSNKLMSYMSNPRSFALKKWFSLLMKNTYTAECDLIIERVASALATDKDVEDFGKVMGGLYESGYRKAVADLKGQMEKHGLQVDIQTVAVDFNEEVN